MAGGSLSTSVGPATVEHPKSPGVSSRLFVLVLLLLVSGAIVRSAISTRLDGFTIDEPYHIATGVSYVRYADFRINPEHPPLVKLWAGAFQPLEASVQPTILQQCYSSARVDLRVSLLQPASFLMLGS
jgi:hypothetical protein